MLLLGHRGARCYAPENTVEAFDRALDHGCDGFEFDVRKTADGQAVVCHDPSWSGRDIASSSFEALLAVHPPLPLLHHVARVYADRAFLYIELKTPGLAELVADVVLRHTPRKGFVVASFLPEALREVHARDAGIPLGLIADSGRDLRRWPELPLDFVMPHHRLVSRDLMNELHEAGKRVFAWTVNDESRMREMSEIGVDGILSDDTALLCRTFGRNRK